VKVSVVIAARNEQDNIEECLRHIPSYPDLEVILVDDASGDETVKRAEGMELPFKLRILRNDSPKGNAFTWDRGARAAGGELIWLIPADELVSGIAEAVGHFKDPKVVQVSQKLEHPQDTFLARAMSLQQRTANHIPFVKRGLRSEVWADSHALMRKSFYLEVSPPTVKAAGEERRFRDAAEPVITAKGYKIVYESKLVSVRKLTPSLKLFAVSQRFYGRNALLNFNPKNFPRDYVRVMRFIFPLTLAALALNLKAATLLSVLTLIRALVGAPAARLKDLPHLPAAVLLTLAGDVFYVWGLIESLAHRILRGKYLIHK